MLADVGRVAWDQCVLFLDLKIHYFLLKRMVLVHMLQPLGFLYDKYPHGNKKVPVELSNCRGQTMAVSEVR